MSKQKLTTEPSSDVQAGIGLGSCLTGEAAVNGQPVQVKKSRGLDPELQAMAKIDRILAEGLTMEQQTRIVCWVQSRHVERMTEAKKPEQPS